MNAMTALGTWINDWREERLNSRQWLLAALALVFAATGYCLLSGLAAGDLSSPSLSIAWAMMVVGVFALGCCLVSAWQRSTKRRPVLRAAGTAALLVGTVTLLACGEQWLAQVYWQRPWTDFAAHVTSRAPLALVVLAIVSVPAWLKSGTGVRRRLLPPEYRPPTARTAILSVPTRSGPRQLSATQIVRVQAAGNYVELYTGKESLLLRATLGSLAERLADSGFVRVHRSAIINHRHIRTIGRDGNGEWLVTLVDGTDVRVGRRYRDGITALEAARQGSAAAAARSH